MDLLEENIDAYKIFRMVQYQFIMSVDGPVDINQLAIHAAIDLMGIKDRLTCFEKVIYLTRWWVNNIIKKRNENA